MGQVAPRWIQSDRSTMDLPVREGSAQSIVDLGGAAWSPDTGTLGGTGTMVLFGHRESHGAPFHNLDLLRPGDALNLRGSDGRNYVYAVVTTRVTSATWEDVLAWTPPNGRGLALVTCHPLGSTSERLVVEAQYLYVS
jgi:sortase A